MNIKKTIALLLALAMVPSLAGCSKKTESGADTATDTAQTEQTETVDTGRLWKSLDGVWEDGLGGYISFSTTVSGYLCDAGSKSPEITLKGTLTDIKADGESGYRATVSFERTETQNGVPTVSSVVLTITPDLEGSPRTVSATDPIKGGTAVYTYAAANMTEYLASLPDPNGMSVEEAFEKLAGIWYTNSDGTLPFVMFAQSGGEPVFSNGVLYSGELYSGTASDFEDDPDNMVMTFYVEIPATETPDYSYEGTTLYVTVVYDDLEGQNKLYVSTYYGESKVEYRYAAASFDELNSIDPNTLVAQWSLSD